MFLLRLVSYIFHPIFIPLGGTLAYFYISENYHDFEFKKTYVLAIFLITVLVPILFYLALKSLRLVSSVMVPDVNERKYPFLISIGLYAILLLKIIPYSQTAALYYFFVGLLAATCAVLLLVLFGFKASVHLLAMGSLLMFLIALSMHFEKNITVLISLMTLATGLVTTSRLRLKAHSPVELFIGLFIGLLCQLFTLKFWL